MRPDKNASYSVPHAAPNLYSEYRGKIVLAQTTIVVIVVVSRQNTQRNNTPMAIGYILLGLNLASEHAAAANAASEVPIIASRAAAPLALLGALAGAARAAAQLLLYS
jgi:hypothetical protein